jgi:hypothetical protein
MELATLIMPQVAAEVELVLQVIMEQLEIILQVQVVME